MEYQVSARKYRPGTFQDVISQPHVVRTLQNAITTNHVAHAYVFSGMRGVGKTTVARILAKALNCESGPTSHPCGTCPSCMEISRGQSVDVIEIDGASNTSVDDVRELRENVKFTPFRGSYRVYIIDEVHMLSNSAFNALLKTLEEPPSHAVFIFATTEVHKIPATILSRCQHFTFRRIPRQEIMTQLRHVVSQTNVAIEDRSLTAIARASDGSMRDALSLLDQAMAFGGDQVGHHEVEALLGSVPDELVRKMVEAILRQDAATGIGLVNQVFDQGFDMRLYCRDIVERMRNLVVAKVVPAREQVHALIELPPEEVDQTITDSHPVQEAQTQEWFHIFSKAEDALRWSSHPRFVLEAAVVRAAHSPQNSHTIPVKEHAVSTDQDVQRKRLIPPQRNPPAPKTLQTIPSPPQRSVQRTSSSGPPVDLAPRPLTKHEQPVTSSSHEEKKPIPLPVTPSIPHKKEQVTAQAQSQDTPQDFDWDRIMDHLNQEYPNIGTFLEIGTLVTIRQDHLVIGYPKQAAVARGRIDKPETRRLVAKICQEVGGRTIQLRVVDLDPTQTSLPTIGQLRAKKQQKDDQGLLEEVRSHPLVKQTLDLFGGEVISARRLQPEEEAS